MRGEKLVQNVARVGCARFAGDPHVGSDDLGAEDDRKAGTLEQPQRVVQPLAAERVRPRGGRAGPAHDKRENPRDVPHGRDSIAWRPLAI